MTRFEQAKSLSSIDDKLLSVASIFEFDLGVIANVRNDNSHDCYLELLMAGYNLDGTLD
jgi:hypothetical protein